jgi:hypothetical protein
MCCFAAADCTVTVRLCCVIHCLQFPHGTYKQELCGGLAAATADLMPCCAASGSAAAEAGQEEEASSVPQPQDPASNPALVPSPAGTLPGGETPEDPLPTSAPLLPTGTAALPSPAGKLG